MERKNLFLLLLILGTAFWGISFSVTKIAIGTASSSTFLFYRFFVASIALSILLFRSVKKTNISDIKTGAFLAIPLFIGIWLQTLGIQRTSASQAAFLAGMCVIITPLMKIFFYRILPPIKIWVASLIALAGLFVISIRNDFSISSGDLYTIIGAFSFAVYLIKVEKFARKGSIVKTIVPMFATCALLTFFIAITDNQSVWLPESNLFWRGIVFCSLFSTAYMYTISNIAQRYISAERVAIIYLFEPIFGAIAAYYLLNESPSWRLLLGGGLILGAMLISEVKFKRKPQIALEDT
ncbi:MAG: DMT family transporter [Pedobacter sp.]|nr:MAG: DMT family transporter [Pedobacter sp.]